jgi:hypothetical protein
MVLEDATVPGVRVDHELAVRQAPGQVGRVDRGVGGEAGLWDQSAALAAAYDSAPTTVNQDMIEWTVRMWPPPLRSRTGANARVVCSDGGGLPRLPVRRGRGGGEVAGAPGEHRPA